MHSPTRSQAFWVFALALLAACGSDDQSDDDGGGAGASNASTGGSSTGGSSTGADSGGSGNGSSTGGRAPSNAGNVGAPPATGGRSAGFGGFAATLGGNPGQGGSPATQGGSPPVATGGTEDPGEPTLESLSPEELGELCADARASFDASGATETAGELTCRTAGIFAVVLFEPSSDMELQQACQDTYDECVAEPLETDDNCAENSMCPATVSEFQACVDEYPAYLEQVAMGLPTCSELTMANLEEALGFEPEATPACESLWAKCPESGGF
jgi:hypothetical protein